jgi:hypothetical protein
MIVPDLDVIGVAIFPFQANPPLIVDANAALSNPIATQRLEAVTRQIPSILQAGGVVENLQSALGLGGKYLKVFHAPSVA